MRNALKAQDLLLALKLVAHPDRPWPGYHPLAAELSMSASEVHAAARRLVACRLLSPTTHRVARRHLLDFLAHGLWHVFPAEEGKRRRGVPTAWSVEPLKSRLAGSEGAVWPRIGGSAEGNAIPPLYPSAPAAALADPALHEYLALVDALRAGRARERDLARAEITRRLAS